MPVRAINRPGSQLLGANGRDDGPIVSLYLSVLHNFDLHLFIPSFCMCFIFLLYFSHLVTSFSHIQKLLSSFFCCCFWEEEVGVSGLPFGL